MNTAFNYSGFLDILIDSDEEVKRSSAHGAVEHEAPSTVVRQSAVSGSENNTSSDEGA